MSEKAKVLDMFPVATVSDMVASKQFYGEVLGFDFQFEYGEPVFYAGFVRDGKSLHLNRRDCDSPLQQSSIYFMVDDVQSYYDEITARGATPEGAPVEQPYGMKDFNILDPDGNVISFGQGMTE